MFVICSGYLMFIQSPAIWCITAFIIASNIFLCADILKHCYSSSTYKAASGKEPKCLTGLQIRGTHHVLGLKRSVRARERTQDWLTEPCAHGVPLIF